MRAVAQSRPPLPLSHCTWLASIARVATAGVLYVWFRRELSIAVGRLKKSGTQRPEAVTSSTRARAAGENSASQRPPSEAKDFCGAK